MFAAFNTADGTVISSLHRRHCTVEFKKFLTTIDARVPQDLDVHLICDIYGTHKSPAIITWLAAHPRFTVHYTPTYSSWINQVERCFGFLTEQLLQRSDHRSVQALERDTSAPGSRPGTRTPDRSSGPSPPSRSSPHSDDFLNELAGDTSDPEVKGHGIQRARGPQLWQLLTKPARGDRGMPAPVTSGRGLHPDGPCSWLPYYAPALLWPSLLLAVTFAYLRRRISCRSRPNPGERKAEAGRAPTALLHRQCRGETWLCHRRGGSTGRRTRSHRLPRPRRHRQAHDLYRHRPETRRSLDLRRLPNTPLVA
ncbi:transposase [Lapillicoccus sp.]|uniref:transposase n=1 Tax=Lapillicoccus sp. TaxID=1909287 RepID=UPI003266FED0